VREHVRPDDRRRHAAEPRKRPTEPAPADSILALQRSAGNRAVSGILARDGTKDEPKKEERGSTMTLGLGDLGVIPLESASWREKESELDVTFVNSPLASKLQEAAAKGKPFPSVFLSTWTMMSKMADVYISNFQLPTSGGEEQPIMVLSLNFKEVAHEPVKK
jgi:hypothetical protein